MLHVTLAEMMSNLVAVQLGLASSVTSLYMEISPSAPAHAWVREHTRQVGDPVTTSGKLGEPVPVIGNTGGWIMLCMYKATMTCGFFPKELV